MHCDVYDTYVRKNDKTLMHFDIIVPQDTPYVEVVAFGQAYLTRVKQNPHAIQAELCRFCHIEKATQEVEQAIKQNGYFILEMEGCPKPTV